MSHLLNSTNPFPKTKIIAITTGDSDGIGFEVTLKALIKVIPKSKNTIFLVSRSLSFYPGPNSKLYLKLKPKICIKKFSCFNNAIKELNKLDPIFKKIKIVEVVSDINPALFVEEAAVLCMKKQIHSLVTGPLSKTTIYSSGLKDMGHTGILKRISKVKTDLFMCFMGNKFNVVSLTGHTPINKIESCISKNNFNSLIKSVLNLKIKLSTLNKNKVKNHKIAIVGLNPHASEGGLIGNFDNTKLSKWMLNHENLIGPLVPDVAFQKNNWTQYFIYICMYHDQALIPFKMIHGQQSGYHLTLGLPFVRTSVDHGTAKDIYKKNIADPSSMLEAIKAAMILSNS